MNNISKCRTNKYYFNEHSSQTYLSNDYVKVRNDEHQFIGSNLFPTAKFQFLIQTGADLYQIAQSTIQANNNLFSIGATRNLFVGDCILAGGFFTQYLDNSPFSLAFPKLYKHCKLNRDINVFINSNLNKTPCHDYNTQSNRRGCINTIHTPFETSPATAFDYHCFKIWRGLCVEYSDTRPIIQNITVYKSLFMDPSVSVPATDIYDYTVHPSFIHINEFLHNKKTKSCLCKLFMRVLKAFFRGFFNAENLLEEMIFARIFFKEDHCKFCLESFDSI
jgi:hypothetical protein